MSSWSDSSSWWAEIHKKGEKKALPLQLIWFSTLVGSLNREPETKQAWGVEEWKKKNSTLKGLQSRADTL